MSYRIRSDLEMEKLEVMLKKEQIPFTTRNNIMGGKGLTYINKDNPLIYADVISDGYGWDKGLLEVQGLGYDCVPLTAEETFDAIRKDYYKSQEKKERNNEFK